MNLLGLLVIVGILWAMSRKRSDAAQDSTAGNMATTTPQTLSDGTYTYILVRAAADVADGTPGAVALYDRVPSDPQFLYTPSLRYLQGLDSVPVMEPVAR